MRRLKSIHFILIFALITVMCISAHIAPIGASVRQREDYTTPSQLAVETVGQTVDQSRLANNDLDAELSNSTRQPSPYRPTIVFVDVVLNTISQINLPEKTYSIAAEIVLEWQDGRIGFKPTSQNNGLLKFNGDDVNLILRKIWAPSFAIANEVQPRETQNRSMSIASNGWIRIYEQFTDVVKFDADVRTFPFSHQILPLSIVSALDDRGSVVFSLRSFKFASPDSSKQVIGRWTPERIQARTQTFNRLDSQLGFTEIVISVEVNHKPQYIIFNFFVPLFIIFIAAAAVTWIDPSKVASYSSPRLGGTVTLILTTIALKLSLTKEIPAVNYITLTDAVFGITVLSLLLSLLVSCTIVYLANERRDEMRSQWILRNFRKIYPCLYIGCLSSLFLFFFSTN